MDPVLYLQYRLYMDTSIRGVYGPSTIYLQYRLYMDTTIMGVYGPSTIYLQYRLYMDTTIRGVYEPSTILTIWIIHTWIPLSWEYMDPVLYTYNIDYEWRIEKK